MYTCIISTLSAESMDQPGMVANPARGQPDRKNVIFSPPSPFAREKLVSRDRFGRPVPRQPAHSWFLLTGSSRFPRRRLFTITITIVKRHRVSLEFIGLRNCVPMAFTAESPLAQGQ